MRPRVFPAEDGGRTVADSAGDGYRFNEAAGIPRGRRLSETVNRDGTVRFNEAAGIPRGRRQTDMPLEKEQHSFNEAAGIPRGRRVSIPKTPLPACCFNEAAGIPRGRRRARTRSCSRRFTSFNEAAGIPRGRPDDIVVDDLQRAPGFNEAAGIPRGRRGLGPGPARDALRASMRPRVFPAEDMMPGSFPRWSRSASMRPRVFPAEDHPGRAEPCDLADRFNEAAGIPRGRHTKIDGSGLIRHLASMRPRVFPAEDV